MYEYYNYSVKFAGEDLRFHGYFETAFKDLKTMCRERLDEIDRLEESEAGAGDTDTHGLPF